MKKGRLAVTAIVFWMMAGGTSFPSDCGRGDGGPCPPEPQRHPSVMQGQGQAQGQAQIQGQGQNQGQAQNSVNTNTNRNANTNSNTNRVNVNPTINVSVTPAVTPNPEPVSREPITLNQTVQTENSLSSSSGNGYDQSKDPALYRQHISPPQATFSSPMWGTGRDANNDMLESGNMAWLPDVTSYALEVNKVKKCELSAKRVYWSQDPASSLQTTVIKHIHGTLRKDVEYRIVGFVSGTCKKGDIFDLHYRIAEQAMEWAGDGIYYIQSGKGQKQDAFTFSFFGGGNVSSLNGDGKIAMGATAGIGPTWASIDFKGYPGAIAAVLELIPQRERVTK